MMYPGQSSMTNPAMLMGRSAAGASSAMPMGASMSMAAMRMRRPHLSEQPKSVSSPAQRRVDAATRAAALKQTLDDELSMF